MQKQETYFEGWDNKDDMERSFDEKIPEDVEILFAVYGGGCYDGVAFVLFRKDGKLFTVDGSHCSCYGLEGQWQPEETTIELLEYIVERGTKFQYDYSAEATKEFFELIKKLKK